MAFGRHESYDENYIEYKENVDMLLHDLHGIGYKDLTKQQLLNVLSKNSFIGKAVRHKICRLLNSK